MVVGIFPFAINVILLPWKPYLFLLKKHLFMKMKKYMYVWPHIHRHLIPRFDKKGFNVLNHAPTKLEDFGSVDSLRKIFLRQKADYEKEVGIKNS